MPKRNRLPERPDFIEITEQSQNRFVQKQKSLMMLQDSDIPLTSLKLIDLYLSKLDNYLENALTPEERAEKQAEIKEKEAEKKKELEEEQKVLSGDYILADSNSRYYSEEELSGLTDREVLFALNEIYARKGRIFSGEEFKRYFESKSWYKGTIPAEEFDANQNERFNEYEKANIAVLVKIAEERGIR